MTKLEQLKKHLVSTGLPVTYRAWPEGKAPALPFICYLVDDTEPLFADGEVYYSYDNVAVELYTAYKDVSMEKRVETALTGYHWKKEQEYIASEKCYMTTYEIEV